MGFSNLYYTILNKPFFIDLRRIEAQAVLIDKFLEHDIAAMSNKKLSDEQAIVKAVATGSVVGGSFDKAPKDSVAVIPLKGDMMKEGTMCSYGTEEIAQLLTEAAMSDRIVGIRLDIDSGGGAVDAIAPMLDAIRFAQQAGKPVVACCDLCASAAYYVACHCDEIVAANDISSEFGSIGVMMQFPDYAKYYEQHGIKIHTIYSDLSSYKNAPFEAAKRGDYKSIKEETLNPLARQFQEAVKTHRRTLNNDTEGILNGRMFFAREAMKVGLIDRVGSAAVATEEVRRLAADMKIKAYVNRES